MEKSRINPLIYWAIGITTIGIVIIFMFKSCNVPAPNPSVDRLRSINDSLYNIIQLNNAKTDTLFNKIDSLDNHADTIIQHQDITNKYYKNETYTILNSTATDANKQFRATLKKSDSLLKSGFYTRTYNLRPTTFQSQLQ